MAPSPPKNEKKNLNKPPPEDEHSLLGQLIIGELIPTAVPKIQGASKGPQTSSGALHQGGTGKGVWERKVEQCREEETSQHRAPLHTCRGPSEAPPFPPPAALPA